MKFLRIPDLTSINIYRCNQGATLASNYSSIILLAHHRRLKFVLDIVTSHVEIFFSPLHFETEKNQGNVR